MSNSLTNDKISSPEVLTETNGKKRLNYYSVVNTTNGSNAKSDDKKSIESDGKNVTTSDDKITNNKERDGKEKDERKRQLLWESKKKKIYIQLIRNESKRLIEIITPISVFLSLKTLQTHLKLKRFSLPLMSTIMNASVKRKLQIKEEPVDETSAPETKPKRKRPELPEYSLDVRLIMHLLPNAFHIGIMKCMKRVTFPATYPVLNVRKMRLLKAPLTPEKIRGRIENGFLLVNNQKVDIDYKLKGHDLLTHRLHRHESPVLSAPIPVIHMSNDMLVVDKPPSIPIHPCGKYRHNSVMHVLAKEHNMTDLYNIHRLDRLTSGVLLIARNTSTAQKFHEQIRNHLISKEYVCRVVGKFPDGVVTCDQPLETLSHKIGICIVDPKGKSCSTAFERLNYNGKSSTVLCRPKTGRMHQIRVHLQYLGHPIVNDSFYNNDAFGPQKGKGGEYGKSKEVLIQDIDKQHQRMLYLISNVSEVSAEEREINDRKREIALKALHHYTNREEWHALTEKYKCDTNRLITDTECEECVNRTIDPNPKDLLIYLHAFCYKGQDFEYKTAHPVWALDDWDYD
ncbi:unnamed protein product [Oppiella nova]|uniref:Pseudouridine synthase RsuA/RluA-like domain-containing protein n=1 Tax=Oppiella nova TaxID=334625 RepID=A0A7R9QC95_9ACAR|nr:unnamed protein product [Oppiella nova]CAG2162355.1 unnamed protein product [Oppiella nova]